MKHVLQTNVLQFGLNALDRGYAVLVYDGPGQGEVIRNPPYMPFYPAWEEVLSTILDYVENSFSAYVQMQNIAQSGKHINFLSIFSMTHKVPLHACIKKLQGR